MPMSSLSTNSYGTIAGGGDKGDKGGFDIK